VSWAVSDYSEARDCLVSGDDLNLADHSIPIVIRAGQLKGTGFRGDEQQVFLLTRLNVDLSSVGIQHLRRMDASGLEEFLRGELVQFLAVIFDVEPICDPYPKDEAFRVEKRSLWSQR
jgi:hypothetical protein